jgi:CHASE3 domain sensor protein
MTFALLVILGLLIIILLIVVLTYYSVLDTTDTIRDMNKNHQETEYRKTHNPFKRKNK